MTAFCLCASCERCPAVCQCEGGEPGAPAGQRAGSWRHRLSVSGGESPSRPAPLRGNTQQQHSSVDISVLKSLLGQVEIVFFSVDQNLSGTPADS